MADSIKVYGANWCTGCRRAKRFLGDQRIRSEWHDIELEPETLSVVQEWNGGNNIIPTIVFAAGDARSGSTKQLASAVGEGAAVASQVRQYLDRVLERAGTSS